MKNEILTNITLEEADEYYEKYGLAVIYKNGVIWLESED